ncbi:acetamidase formamidase [Colletotrichum tofieldiae]|nr:acetamidase formamidase [Colletotrichum tofieldiae]
MVRATPPQITVSPGDIVTFDLHDSSGGQVTPAATTSSFASLDLSTFDPIFGPVAVSGAVPGDVLQIEILSLTTSGWGFTGIIPGFGLLSDEFPNHVLKHYTWAPDATHIAFAPGIRIPLRPFLGWAGIAPAEDGDFSTIPPLETGGNMDCRHITQGTKLYLPGDGEVCGTAIETPMKAALRFTIRKDMPYVTSPHYDTRGSVHGGVQTDPAVYAVLGIDSDLLEASRKALRSLIAHLVVTRGLEREEAYMLCSVAADLRIAEAVDMPNFAVAASLPYSVFEQ